MKRLLSVLLLMILVDSAALPQIKDPPDDVSKRTDLKPKEQDPVESPLTPSGPARPIPAGISPPDGYVIGPEDVLQIIVTKEPELSVKVFVRPDGMISYPTLNDLKASGLTPAELKANITMALLEYVKNPQVSVLVLEIRSSVLYVHGAVAHPGIIPYGGPIKIMDLLARVGPFQDFAKTEKIQIRRTENGKEVTFKFDYKKYIGGKDSQQNIVLRSGDTVIVP